MTAPRYQVHGEIHADGKTLVLFGTGNIVEAIGRLHLLTPHFTETEPRGGLKVALRWPVVVQLAGELGAGWMPGPKLQAWIAEQVRVRSNPPELRTTTPSSEPPPRSYQVAGARMIAATGHVLIWDDPGTGKTLTTLLGLRELQHRGVLPLAAPIVVVCPASVVSSWVRDASRWLPELNPVAWRGPGRAALADGRHGLLVLSYEVAVRDVGTTLPQPAGLAIDESHLIKNAKAARSRAVMKLARRASAVVAISGTPITHHVGNVHPALQALDPISFPSRERFDTRYLDVVAGDYSDDVLGLNKFREPEFRALLYGAYRRLAKEDVLPELPPKVYTQREVALPPAHRRAYDEMANEMLAKLDDGQEMPAFDVLARMQRLLQLANSACDVEITHGPDVDEDTGLPKMHVHVTPKEPSWKIDELVTVLDEREGQRALVSAPSRALVELAGARLEREGRKVCYITGRQTAKAKAEAEQRFQAGEFDVCCLTPGAGGVGITLTAASVNVLLQRPWSYVEATQVEDRCHRLGSEIHDSIEVVDIIATDTVDSQVRAVLGGKAEATAELLGDPRIARRVLGGA